MVLSSRVGNFSIYFKFIIIIILDKLEYQWESCLLSHDFKLFFLFSFHHHRVQELISLKGFWPLKTFDLYYKREKIVTINKCTINYCPLYSSRILGPPMHFLYTQFNKVCKTSFFMDHGNMDTIMGFIWIHYQEVCSTLHAPNNFQLDEETPTDGMIEAVIW